MDAMRLAEDERTEFAELLGGLTSEQWVAASLCAGWRVRDVVAHVYGYEGLGPLAMAGRFVRGGVLPDRVNDAEVASSRSLSTEELLARARRWTRPTGLTAGFGGRIALTDTMIHQQDVRRPLGLPRSIPAPRMTATLDFARTAPTLSARSRIRGLTLTATDLDWTTGSGPAVEGPAESLLMAIAGRRAAVDELTGDGVPVLAARVGG